MRTAWNTYPIEVTGGLITNIPPLQQGLNAPGSGRFLTNMEPSIEGGYKKIMGFSKWSTHSITSASRIMGVAAVAEGDAIAVAGGKYYLSTSRGAWTELLDLSATPGGKVRHVMYDFLGAGKAIFVDGVNKPVLYDPTGPTIAEDTAAPSDVQGASFVTVFKNHIFFGNGTNLVFTAPFTDDDYAPGNGAGVINVGSPITGLVVFRQQLIIFSADKINTLIGSSSSDFVMQPITSKTGCVHPDSIQEVGGDIIYLGPDGVRFLSATQRNEDFALERVSQAVQRDIEDAFIGCPCMCSVVIRGKNQYRLFKWDDTVSRSSSIGYLCTRYLDQEASGSQWAKMEGIKAFSADSKLFGDREVIIFSTSNEAGENYVYELESGASFDGASIRSFFLMPDIPITDPKVRKTFYRMTVYVKAATPIILTSGILLDRNDNNPIQPPTKIVQVGDPASTALYGSAIYGTSVYSSPVESVLEVNLEGSGFTVSPYFENDSDSAIFSLDTIILEYMERDKK